MAPLVGTGLACAGAICACVTGMSAWSAFEGWRSFGRYRRRLCADEGDAASSTGRAAHSGARAISLDEMIVKHMIQVSGTLALGHGPRLAPPSLVRSKWIEAHAPIAGLAGSVSAEGFCETRLRMALICALVGALLGAVVSTELMALLFACGAVLGWRLPARAIKRRVHARTRGLEQHLPEMLDVVALGMRSGLSFDRSLTLYTQHFDTPLSAALDSAQRQWSCGLVARDEALRHVASTYDSVTFARVVEGIIRSLRFGSSMVEGLEASAAEARTSHRAHRQEQVAKAPVKMMIPTGVLILPAMLILVLGPVLLELAGGI